MLQFITNGKNAEETINQIFEVIEGGCKWIQIRMKKASAETILSVIEKVSSRCIEKGVVLIVDDHVELAGRSDVSGVHLGRMDMSPIVAREILGPEKIIGFTINTLEQAESAHSLPVDYYGVGPWRYTVTKEQLASILGPEGVKKIIRRLKKDNPERSIVVIGGVTSDDINEIISMGGDGIAISGALTVNKDMKSATRNILNELNKYTNV